MLSTLRRLLRVSRPLTWAFWVNVALLVFALAAMPFDHRLILGIDPWIKPMKFDVSVLVYAVTVMLLLHLLGTRGRRMQQWIGLGVGISMIVENAIISLQSLRGVRSHMNYTSALNASLFAVMGAFIVLNTVLIACLLGLYLGRTTLPRTLAWAARLGLVAFLAGSVEGARISMRAGHTVGAPDGSPGLPVLNWSYTHGDLRIAHFFALHALQLCLLAGWGLTRTRLPERAQLAILVAGYTAYMAGTWLLFAQAMRGQPLFR